MDNEYFSYIDIKGELFEETKNFLKNFGARRSSIMIDAIRKADCGNNHMLNAIRSFRATPCEAIKEVEIKEIEIDCSSYKISLRMYSQKSDSSAPKPILIYAHGGGWTIGDINSCADFCQNLAASQSANVVAFNYRLAPEHKSPAALDDCETVYNWVIANIDKICGDIENIYVGGDSAGGHLSLALTDRLILAKNPKPRALILFYPVTTFENRQNDSSYKEFGAGYALDACLMDAFNDAYMPDYSMRKNASPLNFTTLDSFPPTLLISSGHDILRDQDKEFADILYSKKIPLRHVCLRGATHIYVTMAGMPKCFEFALKETRAFIEKTRA